MLAMFLFQSTLPARGATHKDFVRFAALCISIHAPREGSDFGGFIVGGYYDTISIHAPREGSDTVAW